MRVLHELPIIDAALAAGYGLAIKTAWVQWNGKESPDGWTSHGLVILVSLLMLATEGTDCLRFVSKSFASTTEENLEALPRVGETEAERKARRKIDGKFDWPLSMPWEVVELPWLGPLFLLLLQGVLWSLHLSGASQIRIQFLLTWSLVLFAAHTSLFLRSVCRAARLPLYRKMNSLAEFAYVGFTVPFIFRLVVLILASETSTVQASPSSPSASALEHLLHSQSFALNLTTFLLCLMVYFNASKCIKRHSENFRGYMCTFFITFHIFAFVGLYRWYTYVPASPDMPSRGRLMLEMIVLYVLGGLGITAGAHRLWAHRSYKANAPYRYFIMVLNSIALQGDIYHWATDHRLHHRYSEKEPDPHNALKGFFYAHMGWLLRKRPRAVVEGFNRTDVSDLREDGAVMLQHNLDPIWNLSWCFLLPSLYALVMYNDFWLGFFTLGCMRWIWTLHCTWTVNSVAHLYGPRPYNDLMGPVESFVTSLLACGEGWHNWHHQYGFDYATSEQGALSQYNPTKVFIDFFAEIGWVTDRKRAVKIWEATKRKRAEKKLNALRAIRETAVDSSDAATSSLSASSTSALSTECDVSSGGGLFNAGIVIDKLSEIIPAGCHKISLLKSTLYLLRDLIFVTAVSCTSAAAWILLSRFRTSVSADSHVMQRFLFNLMELGLFVVYSLGQGTVMVALWVASYECSGGRFSRSKSLNTAVGFVLSTLLMIPYSSRREKEASHGAAHLSRALNQDNFSYVDISRWTSVSPSSGLPAGGISGVCSFILMGIVVYYCGWYNLCCWYLGPCLVMNFWFILYHRLLLIKVHKAFNDRHALGDTAEEIRKQTEGTAKAAAQRKIEDVLDDIALEEMNGLTPETDLAVDPHAINEYQKQAKLLAAQPLCPNTVEFFNREWFFSALDVFDKTILLKKAADRDAEQYSKSHIKIAYRLLIFFFGWIHHHLGHMNVLQSVDLSIPHYHAKEAVKALRDYVRAAQEATAQAAAAIGSTTSKGAASAPQESSSTSKAVFRAVSQTARITQQLVEN